MFARTSSSPGAWYHNMALPVGMLLLVSGCNIKAQSAAAAAAAADICRTPERQPWIYQENEAYLTQVFNSNWTFAEGIMEPFRSHQQETLSILNELSVSVDSAFTGSFGDEDIIIADPSTSTTDIEWMPFVISSNDMGLMFDVTICSGESQDPTPQFRLYEASSSSSDSDKCGELTRLVPGRIGVEDTRDEFFNNNIAPDDLASSPPCTALAFLSQRNYRYAILVRGNGNYKYTIQPSEALVCPKEDSGTDGNHFYRKATDLVEGSTTIDFAQASSFQVSGRSCRFEFEDSDDEDDDEDEEESRPGSTMAQREIGLWYRYNTGPSPTGKSIRKATLSLSSLDTAESDQSVNISTMGISVFDQDCESSSFYPLYSCVGYASKNTSVTFDVSFPNQTYYFLVERNATDFSGLALLTLEIDGEDGSSPSSGASSKKGRTEEGSQAFFIGSLWFFTSYMSAMSR